MFYLAEDQNITDEISEEMAQQTNFISNWFQSIDWNAVGARLITMTIQIIITIIAFYILRRLGFFFIDMIFTRYRKSQVEVSSRYQTIYNLIRNLFNGLAVFMLVYVILTIFSIPVGTLLAGAGILGLAISFGAQGYVSDIVNGLAMLLENQLDIGDDVLIDGIEGTVINISLRMITVRDFDGTIHYIPNREIPMVSNRSKGEMRVLIEIRLFPETDLEKVRSVMTAVNEELVPQTDSITTPPKEIMFFTDAQNQFIARTQFFTQPGEQMATRALFHEHYITALNDAGIELPSSLIDLSNNHS